MATAVEIGRRDMHTFLAAQGFTEVQVPGTKERVYSKLVDKGLCLRVLTSIVGETSRGNGEDAIRTVLVTKVGNDVKIVGGDKRVHRVEGWRKNLQSRLDGWREQLGPSCPKCGSATVRRRSRRGPFWGCCRYPVCNSIQSIELPRYNPRPVPGERGGEHEEARLARDEFVERAEPAPKCWQCGRPPEAHAEMDYGADGCCVYKDRGEEAIDEAELANAYGVDSYEEVRKLDCELEGHMSDSIARSEEAWQERLAEKAAFAKLEEEQERRAYLSKMERDIAAAGIEDDDPPPASW